MKFYRILIAIVVLAGCTTGSQQSQSNQWYRNATPAQRAAYDRAAAIQAKKSEEQYLALIRQHPEMAMPIPSVPQTIVICPAPTPMPTPYIATFNPYPEPPKENFSGTISDEYGNHWHVSATGNNGVITDEYGNHLHFSGTNW